MKITILQPAYLPWLGFFDRIDASDLCVILDNVRIDSSSKTRFVNRNKIRVKEGWIWLTLPMKNKGLYSDVLIKDISWSFRLTCFFVAKTKRGRCLLYFG